MTRIYIDSNIFGISYIKKRDTILTLTHLNLRQVPAFISQLVYLQELVLVGNEIYKIPTFIETLTHLRILNFSNNRCDNIPIIISKLVNLEDLSFRQNYIRKIPETLKNLINLREIDFSYNKIRTIRNCFTGMINLHKLDLSDNKIHKIPECVASLVSLQELYLSNNNIYIIPNFIGQLRNLTKFSVLGNRIIEIPESLTTLSNLTYLNLLQNNITEIPNDIGQLRNLEEFIIGRNNITVLPDSIGQLSHLSYLDIRHNKIANIPISIIRCNNIQNFVYSWNPIENIAPQVVRFLDRQLYFHGDIELQIYNDGQSVHNHSIQECIRHSIEAITSQNFGKINNDLVISQILADCELTAKTKRLILEYCEIIEAHSVLLITFKELLGFVWNTILAMLPEIQISIKQIMNAEMDDAECKCFTGRLSRLVNCLNGFSPLVRVEIADSQQIGNIIILAKQRLETSIEGYSVSKHQEIVRADLTERGFPEAVIAEWVEFI